MKVNAEIVSRSVDTASYIKDCKVAIIEYIGKGRFSFISFANDVQGETVYQFETNNYKYCSCYLAKSYDVLSSEDKYIWTVNGYQQKLISILFCRK